MKRFIITILCVSVFFIGLGALVEKAGASFKSDEKALDLVRKARVAIGGDSAIAGVQSLRIVGTTSKIFKIDGVERTETGETEIAMQLPDKLMKMMKIGHGDDAAGGDKIIDRQVDVIVVGDAKDKMSVTVTGEPGAKKRIVIKKDDGTVQELTGAEADKFIATEEASGDKAVKHVIIRKPDGTVQELKGAEADKVVVMSKDGSAVGEFKTADGKTVIVRKTEGGDGKHIIVSKDASAAAHHDAKRQNELLRLTLSLLLTAPQGMDVSYTYGGESNLDGTACEIVVAEFGGSSLKIFLGKSSNLPVMMSYTGHKMPQIMKIRTDGPKGGDAKTDTMVITRKMEGPAAESAEFNVRFSDYRSVGGIQLPYRWTQTVDGAADETFDVTIYEINPANIAEKFRNQKVMVRTKKPDGQ